MNVWWFWEPFFTNQQWNILLCRSEISSKLGYHWLQRYSIQKLLDHKPTFSELLLFFRPLMHAVAIWNKPHCGTHKCVAHNYLCYRAIGYCNLIAAVREKQVTLNVHVPQNETKQFYIKQRGLVWWVSSACDICSWYLYSDRRQREQ